MQKIEGNIVDVYRRRIFSGIVEMEDGHIASIRETGEKYPYYILPGFVDAHVHIESSMLVPEEFSRLVISRGTVAIVTDPHEIANVLGVSGIRFMTENARRSWMKIFFTIPSCVPATGFDCSGAVIGAGEVRTLADTYPFVGLSEVMNVPGVLSGDSDLAGKLEVARSHGLCIDGHAPVLSGEDLKRYIAAGISTDHEASTAEEGEEKILDGMKILIREGSAGRNYEGLKSLIGRYPDRLMFCTDDSHPSDTLRYGHIDKLVRRAVADGFDLFDVLRIASVNPVEHYGLPVGTLRVGDRADFIVVDSLKDFNTRAVYVDGERRYVDGMSRTPREAVETPNRFERLPLSIGELKKSTGREILAIRVEDGQLLTGKAVFPMEHEMENLESDTERDILKLVYLNRYGNTEAPQIAYITGFGLRRGAFATSISHDSHNIIAAGCSDADLLEAINAVIAHKGALAVSERGVTDVLPLPIAGIISDRPAEEVASAWDRLTARLHTMGSVMASPFMTLSFMALVVIPELKIGEKGLFDFSSFRFI